MRSLQTTPRFSGGEKVRDTVTGFVGTVTGYSCYVHGGESYEVTPVIGANGEIPKAEWIADSRLEPHRPQGGTAGFPTTVILKAPTT